MKGGACWVVSVSDVLAMEGQGRKLDLALVEIGMTVSLKILIMALDDWSVVWVACLE